MNNRFLILFLLVTLAFAHLPSTPASLRRSAAHKKRLDGPYSPSTVALHRRLSIGDILQLGDDVRILGQTPDGIVSAIVNGVTTTFSVDPAQTPSSSYTPSSDTPSSSSESPAPTPPPPTSSPPDSVPSSSESSPLPSDSSPSPSDPSPSPSESHSSLPDPPPSSSTPEPTPSPNLVDSLTCILGRSCPPPSTQASSSTDVPPQTSDPSPGTSDPSPQTSDPSPQSSAPPPQTSNPSQTSDPPQTNQPPSTTNVPPSSPTVDNCLLFNIGCLSSTPVNSDSVPTQPPPASSTPVATQPQPSSTPHDHCLLFGIGCLPSSNPPVSSGPTRSPPTSSNPVATQPQPSSTSDDQCAMFGIGCLPSSNPPGSSGPTQSPPASTSPGVTQPRPSSTPGDSCLLFSIGCPSSSIPKSGDPTSTGPPQVSTRHPHLTTLPLTSEPPGSSQPPSSLTTLPLTSETPGSSQLPSSEPLSTTGVSLSSNGSTSAPSATPIIFPTLISSLPSSSTRDSLLTSTLTSAPVPTNTQFGWLTQTSLIFSSFSESVSDSMSLTDPDQVPTSTSFPTTGTPSVAPSAAPLPPGVPARILPGDGGVTPADDLNGLALITILFDRGLAWDLVVHNSDSPGQIFLYLPSLIQSALGITSDQVKSFALQVWVPSSYKDPSDISLLKTTWMGFIPKPLVETLAAQIKVKNSLFYTVLPSPYKDLAVRVDPSFDIMTVTATTGIPGSGGPNNSLPGGTSDNSRTRENAIIGVVSALGGITLIILGYLIYRAVQKRRELAHRRLSDPPANAFVGEAPPNRNFDQDSIGGQRRRSFYFAEDSLRGFSDHNYTNDGARLSPEQTSGLNRRQIAGNIGPPVMRENSLNF